MKVSCPFCGSENVSKKDVVENYPVPFCDDADIRHKVYLCHDCEEEGDFDGTDDKRILSAIKKADARSAAKLMEDLAADGITMTYLEKALRIPFRTTARWKRGNISHSALALLRLVRFSPQLLEVADDNFSEEAKARYQFSQSCIFFKSQFDCATGVVIKSEGNFSVGLAGWNTTTPSQIRMESGTQAILELGKQTIQSKWVTAR